MTIVTMNGHYRGRRPRQLGVSPTDLPHVLPAPIEYLTPTGRAALATDDSKRPVNSLLASARRLTRRGTDTETGTSPTGSGSRGVQVAQWQEDAWGMYDIVGEQRYLANTLANQLGKARILVGRRAENGEGVDEADLPDEVLRTFEAFGGSPSARAQIVTRLGVNLFIAGDGWLVGIPERLLDGEPVVEEAAPAFVPALRPIDRTEAPADLDENDAVKVAADPDGERLVWRMLSVSEVATVDDDIAQLTLPEDGGRVVEAPLDELYLIRVWRPHPRRAWEADSPTRASLPVLRELVGLTMHISAQVDSRLAGAGILTIPQSAAQALARASGTPEAVEEDMVTEALMLAMQTAIKDRDSAAALVPLVLTLPDEAVGKIEHITFSTPLDSEARALRDEAIRRLALSQDAPPEVLLGTGDMNHWGAWLVQEETVSTHLEPPLALICDALTTEYLHPVLEAAGVPDFDQYVIDYDVDALVSSPTRGADAQSAFGLGVISDKAVREALGFEETDSPFGDTLDAARTLVFEMVKANPALLVTPGVGALVSQMEKLLDPDATLDPTPLGEDSAAPATPALDSADPARADDTGTHDAPTLPREVGQADLTPVGPNE